LALDKDIPESGTRDEHRVRLCIVKDRINIQDKRESSRKLLDGCLRDNEVWHEQMGKNLRMIEVEAAILEHNEDFLE